MKSEVQSAMTRTPLSIADDVGISDAQEIMRSWGMRHIPVMSGEKLVGVISDRDLLHAFALQKPGDTRVDEIMTRSPYHVSGDTGIAAVAKTMADHKLGCAVVTDEHSRVTGIFTTTDALNLLSRLLHEPEDIDYRILTLSEYFSTQDVA